MLDKHTKNQITASVEFHFKGEKIVACIDLDLDLIMQSNLEFPDLYPLLAHTIDLDVYSYEYEMLQAGEIKFSEAKGSAADFLRAKVFEIDAFKHSWRENEKLQKVSDIAERHMNIRDLNREPKLKAALLEAYAQGEALL